MTDKERDKAFRKARAEALKQRTAIQRDTAAEVTRLLKLAQEKIRLAIATAPSDWAAWYLPQLQQAIRQALAEMGDAAAQRMSTEAGRAWEAGIGLVDKPLAAAGVEIAGLLPVVDTRQLMAMRTFMTDRMKDVGLALANKINSELGLVAIGAQTQGDAVAKIAKLLEGGRGRAITIIRTELGRAYSTAAQERMTQAAQVLVDEDNQPLLKKQWRRSGKIHSRLTHDAADGQIQPVDKPFIVGGVKIMYPRSPAAPAKETINCGCESLPYMESWKMSYPKKKPFSDLELQQSKTKRDLNDAQS